MPGWQLSTRDFAGPGTSVTTGRFSIAGFAAAVATLVETLPGPVVRGGIFIGAATATRIAVLRPDLVRGLVPVRPAWLTDAAPPSPCG